METIKIVYKQTGKQSEKTFPMDVKAISHILYVFGYEIIETKRNPKKKTVTYKVKGENKLSFSKFWDALSSEILANPTSDIPEKFIDWQLKDKILAEEAQVTKEYDIVI